ncbi:hypothetical protein APR41_18330 [Salegentibacter salinarum]|uniref:Uncharacterized protein n=1 Tax=Salegentibacter salinarum TaxID=447422 RepID=A0A2N0TT43_9FLAO|nr:hypothetical protein APR41_18330 [Salegentibacter salinarum]
MKNKKLTPAQRFPILVLGVKKLSRKSIREISASPAGNTNIQQNYPIFVDCKKPIWKIILK